MDNFREEPFDITEYINILRKNRLLIFAITIVSIFVAFIINETSTPRYTATTRIEIRSTPRSFLPQFSYYTDWWSKERELNTHFKIIRSFNILKRVCKKINILDILNKNKRPSSKFENFFADVKEFFFSDDKKNNATSTPTIDSVAASLMKSITITPIKDTNLADISITHTNPEVAMKVANAIADVYSNYLLENRFKEIRDTVNIYTKQLISLKKAMRNSEEKYLKFIQEHGISTMQGKKAITLEGLSDLKLNYTNTKIKRVELESQLKSLEKVAKGNINDILRAPLLNNSTILNQLKQDILKNQLKLIELQKKYQPMHPEIIQEKAILKTLKNKFRQEISTLIQNKKEELNVLQAKEKELNRAIKENESKAIQDSSVALQYKKLKDELSSNKTLYETLTNKIKELDITKSTRENTIRVVEGAELPTVPTTPKKTMNILISIFLGLFLGVGIAFSIEYFDDTFKTVDQIKNILKVPVLAVVCKISFKKKHNQKDLVILNPDLPHHFLESFRFLKTNLILATLNKRHSAIIFTSTGPEEGKTVIAINYALSLAREGKRVLLIDLDLRKPKAHKIFNLQNKKGFTSLIIDPFSSIPLSGSLSEIPLIDLIYLITHNEKSGILRIFSPIGNFTICFVEGKIAQIDSSLREESEKVGNLLINKLGYSKEFIQDAIRRALASKQKLGEYLFSSGIINQEDLTQVLEHQFITTFNKMIAINKGEYNFKEDENLHFYYSLLKSLKTGSNLLENIDIKPLATDKFNELFYISRTEEENLFVLPTGPTAPNPDEIFTSERIVTIINLLKQHFHSVIIDSPPAGLVADSNILSPYVDGVVYVVKYGGFPRKLISNTLERIKLNKGKVFGVTFNMVDFEKESYLSDHYYSSEYYYREEEVD